MLWRAIDGGWGVLAGGGVQEREGEAGRDIALIGAMWLCTLGSPWDGPADSRRFGGAKRRHGSKIYRRVAMAST
jgi:hypothetical protein